MRVQARANSEGVSGNTAARIVATGENRRRLEHEAKVAEEARGDLQREIDALVAWSTQEARPQLARLADTGGLDGVQALAQSAHDHAATLQQSHQAAEQKLSVASEELSRHRDAIVLVVDTVDNLSRDIKATQEGLGSGLSEVREVSDQRARLMERACSHLSGECDALRYGIRRGEQRTQEQAEAVGLLQLAQGRSAEWQKASEQEVSEVRHEIASQVSTVRGLKTGGKDTGEALSQHKASTHWALDDIDKWHQAYGKTAAVFAEALHLPNPLATSMVRGGAMIPGGGP